MMNRESYELLYGRAARRHNPGEYQNVDGRRARAQQCPRASVHGCARREHVVDQNEPSTRHLGSAMGRHAKGTLDVLGALGLAEPDLLGRCLDAFERRVCDRPAARLGDDLGQQRRLVEPSRPLPPPVQRHRNDGVGVGKQLAAGTRHPASHGRGEVEPVAVFKGMDELARDIVVAHGGAGAAIRRRIDDRFHRQEARSAIEGEWDAEPLAIGRRDERELGPADGTQTRAVDRLATGRAELRQRDVEHEPEAGAQRAAQPGKALGRDGLALHGGEANAASCEPQRCSGQLRRALVPLRGDPTSSLRPRRGNEKTMVSAHPLVFDRRRQRTHWMRAAALGPSTFLIERVAEDLSDRLATVLRRFECALDLGTPTDSVRRVLAASGKVGTIIAADALAGDPAVSRHWARETVATAEREEERTSERTLDAQLLVAADEEALPFRDASLDLVVSALALQFVNDLPGTLIQIRRALKPDGLLLAALAGGETLTELRQTFAAAEAEVEGGISPRVIPFPDVREMGALLQRAGFALPVTDVDRLTVRYPSPISLMHDLRRMGATNALRERSRRPLKRATLRRMIET